MYGKTIKKVYGMLGVVSLILFIVGTMLQKKNEDNLDMQKDVCIENEGEILHVILYSISSYDQTYLITLFDSGRLETIRGLRDHDEIRGREGISEIRSRKSVWIEETELKDLLRLAEEFTSETIMGPSDRDTFSGATYFRVTFQERSFEIWTVYLMEEGREFFGVENEYDTDICAKAFEFLELIQGLSAVEIRH